jgi:hypothetical protein
MRIKLLWFYLFLTEGLVVYSNLSILLLSILCLKISLKTAVNSICLGTCSSCFVSFDSQCLRVSRSGCKVQLLFNLASVFESFFENFRFSFFLIAPLISATTYSICLRTLSVRKDNYLFHFSNLFLPLKDIFYSLSIKISKNVCCYCGCKTNTFIP